MNEATITEAAEKAGEALQEFGGAAAKFAEVIQPDEKRPPARTELRAASRAFVASGYRANKARIAQDVANERGTLPDARELAKIAKARRAVNEQLKLAKAKAAHPAGTQLSREEFDRVQATA